MEGSLTRVSPDEAKILGRRVSKSLEGSEVRDSSRSRGDRGGVVRCRTEGKSSWVTG